MSVVTGASEGIGLALARGLTAKGHSVLLIARDPVRLEAAANKLSANARAPIATLVLDLSSAHALERLDAELAAHGAYVDVLVNNAGLGLSGPFAEASAADIDAVLNLNIAVPTRLARYVLPGMLARGSGGILFVGSLGGFAPGPGQAAYYATKAYLMSLSEALAQECAGRGVTITCVAPGPVATTFHDKMGAGQAPYRWLLPHASTDATAAVALLGFAMGARVITPGILPTLVAPLLRLAPHRLTAPILAALLRSPKK